MQSGVHGERAPRAPCRAPRAAHRASTGIRNALGRRVYPARARNTAREARALPQPRHPAFSALIPSLPISERSYEPLPAKKPGGKRTDLAGTGGRWRKGNCKLRIANCKLRTSSLQPGVIYFASKNWAEGPAQAGPGQASSPREGCKALLRGNACATPKKRARRSRSTGKRARRSCSTEEACPEVTLHRERIFRVSTHPSQLMGQITNGADYEENVFTATARVPEAGRGGGVSR